jgi:hypothetical protein
MVFIQGRCEKKFHYCIPFVVACSLLKNTPVAFFNATTNHTWINTFAYSAGNDAGVWLTHLCGATILGYPNLLCFHPCRPNHVADGVKDALSGCNQTSPSCTHVFRWALHHLVHAHPNLLVEEVICAPISLWQRFKKNKKYMEHTIVAVYGNVGALTIHTTVCGFHIMVVTNIFTVHNKNTCAILRNFVHSTVLACINR